MLKRVVCMDDELQTWMRTGDAAVDPVIHTEWDNGLPNDPHDIMTVICTSGSSGRPKGVATTERWFRYDVSHPMFINPLVTVSFIPLSHSTDRMRVWESMLNGGRCAFVFYAHKNWEDHEQFFGPERLAKLKEAARELRDNGTMQLLEEVSLVRPSVFISPPRVWKGIELFARNLGLEFVKSLMGDRVTLVATGGGPTADSTFDFVEKELLPGVSLLESYGATEAGGIASGRDPTTKRMKVIYDAIVRLVEIPELGIVHPLGEAWMRNKKPGVVASYWRNPEDMRAVFETDSEGHVWFKTGDICEGEFDPETGAVVAVRVVERKKNFTLLASGAVFLPETIETMLEPCRAIHHVCALPTSDKKGYVLVVNTVSKDINTEETKKEIIAILAAQKQLPPTAIFFDFDLWEMDSKLRKQGMLTVSLKPNRIAIQAKFADKL
jgi:long-subunit acyl-CoA synthetase (AMP-forming)